MLITIGGVALALVNSGNPQSVAVFCSLTQTIATEGQPHMLIYLAIGSSVSASKPGGSGQEQQLNGPMLNGFPIRQLQKSDLRHKRLVPDCRSGLS